MIKVRSKTLFIPAEEQSIGAVGEADSTVREFHIDRVSGDGVDLANLLFKLNIRYAGVREIDRSDLEKVVTDNAIILRWLISSVTMRHAGTAFIQLDAFDNTGSCRWKSYPGAVYIEKSIGTEDVPKSSLSELEQLEKKFSTLDAQEEERKTAEEKRVTAEGKREEAETRRNASLSNIVAEEAKIVALSNETKGYRDSVASDKAQVSELKQNADALKVAMEQKITTATMDFNEKLSSVNSLTVEVREKTNTVANLTAEIKEKANAVSSATEEVKGIRTALNSVKSDTQTIADRARTDIQGSVASATDSMNKAKASADSAKDSETKTLEALKKAQEGGKVVGVTTDEMHSYVDTAVGKIKSGITETEAIAVVGSELKKKEVQKDEVDYYKLVNDFNDSSKQISIPSGKLATTDALYSVFGAIRNRTGSINTLLEAFHDSENTAGKSINYRLAHAETQIRSVVINFLRNYLSENRYGRIKVWDYIDIPTTIPGTEKMRFYVMAIDMDESKNSIDFISFDYPERILMTEEELKSFDTANDEKILGLVNNKIKSDQRLGELNSLVSLGLISKIKRFYGNTKTQNEFHFWTIDAGEVLGSASAFFPYFEGREMTVNASDNSELFKTRKYRKIMNKGKYLTCSCRPDFVAAFDENGIPRALSLKDAFGALPQGTSQEDVLKLRPIIPVCFRVTAY